MSFSLNFIEPGKKYHTLSLTSSANSSSSSSLGQSHSVSVGSYAPVIKKSNLHVYDELALVLIIAGDNSNKMRHL